MSLPVRAAGGAYLADDASVTPAGLCQLEMWLQALSGGQSLLTVAPACSNGPVEWTFGVAAQRRPFQHLESQAVKWMLRDTDNASWGGCLQADVTYSNGDVLTQSTYAAATFACDDEKRWSLNTEAGALRRQGSRVRPLVGAGVEWKTNRESALLAKHLRSAQGPSVFQAGIRWVPNHSSVDLIAGTDSLIRHDRWLTPGWNRSF